MRRPLPKPKVCAVEWVGAEVVDFSGHPQFIRLIEADDATKVANPGHVGLVPFVDNVALLVVWGELTHPRPTTPASASSVRWLETSC